MKRKELFSVADVFLLVFSSENYFRAVTNIVFMLATTVTTVISPLLPE